MTQPKNVLDIERNAVAKGLKEMPESFLKLSYSKMDNDSRRVWFMTSGVIDWKEAACAGQDPAWWFPERGQNDLLDLALSICGRCPLKTECLAFALCTGEDEGVWGGTTGRERKANGRRLLEYLRNLKHRLTEVGGSNGKNDRAHRSNELASTRQDRTS